MGLPYLWWPVCSPLDNILDVGDWLKWLSVSGLEGGIWDLVEHLFPRVTLPTFTVGPHGEDLKRRLVSV